MKNNQTPIIVLLSLFIGVFIGFLSGSYYTSITKPTHVDVQLRGYAVGYGSLINITEKNNEEAIKIMYTIINSSLKEMYNLYPSASEHHKEMIAMSYQGYTDNIKNNKAYTTNTEVNLLVDQLLKKHNKAVKRD